MRFALLSLFLVFMLGGCNFSAGVDSLPTPTEAAEIIEPTATHTPPPAPTAEPTATPTAEPTAAPTAPPTISSWIAYVGADSNLWLGNPQGGEVQQLTLDGRPWLGSQPGETVIAYADPQWSSDGRWLAYKREVSTPAESGYSIRTGLWVYDLKNMPRQLVEQEFILGFAWRPGSTLIAYGRSIDPNYFLDNAAYAQGIWAVEAGTGESYELVPPVKGLSLVGPGWSPNGRYLAFDEVLYMEGRGNFAYYDFETQEYVGWEQAIGNYTWLPDGQQLAYDRLTYAPQGSERIWLNDRRGGSEMAFGPDYEPGYAFSPSFSPRGERLAYLASQGDLDNTLYTLFVMEIAGGVPRDLGAFEQTYGLAWSPDGQWLALTAGPYGGQQVILVSLADGSQRVLAQGSQPAWQPLNP
jgi:Tol biopolymer transport system component